LYASKLQAKSNLLNSNLKQLKQELPAAGELLFGVVTQFRLISIPRIASRLEEPFAVKFITNIYGRAYLLLFYELTVDCSEMPQSKI